MSGRPSTIWLIATAATVAAATAVAAQPQPASPPAMVMALPVSGTYAIDPTHTQVRAVWNHMGLSRPGATFETVQGTIVIDVDRPERSSLSVRIPISGVDTGVPDLDRHFHSPDYFDSAHYPEARFVSRSVNVTGMGNAFTVAGDLTIRGVTRPVELEAVLNGAGPNPMSKVAAVGFSAKARIRRSDFGINAVIPLVSDEIDLVITAEAGLKP